MTPKLRGWLFYESEKCWYKCAHDRHNNMHQSWSFVLADGVALSHFVLVVICIRFSSRSNQFLLYVIVKFSSQRVNFVIHHGLCDHLTHKLIYLANDFVYSHTFRLMLSCLQSHVIIYIVLLASVVLVSSMLLNSIPFLVIWLIY